MDIGGRDLSSLRIGYTSYPGWNGRHPADRLRFVHVATALGCSVVEATPGGQYDLVVVSDAADVTAWSREPRGPGHPRLIYDLVDSYLNVGFFNSPRDVLRGLGKFVVGQSAGLFLDYREAKIAMCRRADAVVCSTPEQQAVLSQYNASVTPILDFTSLMATARKAEYAAGTPFRITWQGLGSNAHTLAVIAEPLRALAREMPIELHLVTQLDHPVMLMYHGRRSTVSQMRRLLAGIPIFFHEWNEFMLNLVSTACDLAVLPIPDSKYSNHMYRYKPENRLCLYWRMGLPVLASATPSHTRTMRDAGQPENLCATADEWAKRLHVMAVDHAARRAAGVGGRGWVEQAFSDEVLMGRWESVLRRVLAPGSAAT